MKILGIIPARGGSKGIPRKNIKFLGKKPLLQYTAEIALKSKLLTNVILSSDDDEIINVGLKLGVEVPFKRPKNLANDKAKTLLVVQHALNYYEKIGINYDAVCILQVTSPFRTLAFLDKAISMFIKNNTDSLISVLRVPHEYNPHWTFKKNDKNELEITTKDKVLISRRQDLPEVFYRDGSIYLTKTNTIQKENSLYGNSISYIESNTNFHVNIDTQKDWKRAEEILNEYIQKCAV